jgi:hypothetical protein|tara:strand:+ start:642 stop:782 length:141 start_codon:yes stop_codon:yes gene_type:complete
MTTRQFVDSKGNTWEWEETPEVLAAVAQLHKTIAENKQTMPVTITE